MNDDLPDYSRLLIVAGVSSFSTVALTSFFHGSPTLVLCVGVVTLLVVFLIGQFVRNRFQLGLRSLILLLTAAAVLMGLFGSRMNGARTQKQAVNSILGLRIAGGKFTEPYSDVHYEYADLDSDFFTTKGGWLLPIWVVEMLGKDFFFAVNDINIQNQDLSAEDSLDDVQLEHFSTVYISNCMLSEGAVRRLIQQDQIRDLSLVDVDLNDAQLAAIVKGMPRLTRLEIGFAYVQPVMVPVIGPQHLCSVTNEGVRHLTELSELTELTLNRTKATGACLHDLAKLPKLRHFACPGLSMTDSEVELFRNFKSLNSITLYGTRVDEAWIPFLESLNLEWVAFTVSDKSRIDEIHERSGKPIFSVQ